MLPHDPSWSASQALKAPTWLPRIAVYREETLTGPLFRPLVDRLRDLEHLDAPLDPIDPSVQLEALAARHRRLRDLALTSAVEGVSTAALASLPLQRVVLAGRLLASAAGCWSAGLGAVPEVVLRNREVTIVGDAAAWAGLRACTSLDLLQVQVDAASLRAIAALPALARLTLRSCVLPPGAGEILASSPHLRRLTVQGGSLTSADAKALAGAPALEVAVLSVSSAADAKALAPLAARRGLALGVELRARTPVDDALIAAICGALPRLVGLSLHQRQIVGLTKKLTPAGLAPIGGLDRLRWLSLDGLYVRGLKPADLGLLAGLPALRSLSLRHAAKLSAAVVDLLAPLSELRALDLRAVPLSDAAAKKLAHLPLERLALSDAKLGPRGLASLAGIPTLTALSLEHAVGFTDPMLEALRGAAGLTWLDLAAPVTGKTHPTTLAPLAALPVLHTLAVAEVGLCDAWIRSLAPAPALRALRFTRRDSAFTGGKVSDAGVDAAIAIPTLETVECWSFPPSPTAQAAIEAAGHAAWVPGGYGQWLSIEPSEDAPLR